MIDYNAKIKFKPAQTAIDRVFINRRFKYEKVGVSSIVTETYLSIIIC